MDEEDLQCGFCKETFAFGSQPRMMPFCGHSACTNCLKKIIADKTTTSAKCLHCGH